MAYQLLSNSPVSGQIAWSGVHLVYDGVDYTIADGSTANRFVYWLKSAPTVFQTNSTLPTLGPDDTIVFLNKNGVAINVLNASALEGDLVVPGTMTASALAVDAVAADHIQSDAIVARHILAGEITAAHMTVENLAAISADLGNVTAGTFTLDQAGFIRGGATDFATGAGIWQGWDVNAYKWRAGVPGSSMVEWNGTAFNVYDGSGNLTISSGIVDYTKLGFKPVNLAGINSAEGSKLSGITAGATKNIVTFAATAPSSPVDGAIWVDTHETPHVTKVRVAGNWEISGNYTVKTSELSDDAMLGKTADFELIRNKGGFLDTFETGNADQWQVVSGSGEVSVVTVTDSLTGGKVLRVGNNSGNDNSWLVHKNNVPFDPTAMYRIKFRVRRTAGSGTIYMGLAGVAADGTSWVNTAGSNATSSQHYVAGSSKAPGTSWTEYVAYVKGTAASGNGSASNSVDNPATLHSNVRYVRPMMILNYSAAAGTMEVDFVSIENLTESVTWSNVAGSGKPEDGATVGAPTGTYVGGQLAEALVADAAQAKSDATTAKSDALAANTLLADIASDSKLTASEKQQTKVEWDGIVAEKAGINAQASAFSITTENTAYNTAYNALSTYLSPLLSNLTVTSDIVGTTFRTKFSDLYAARQALLNKIAAVAATKAQWGNLSDRPTDNELLNSVITGRFAGTELIADAATVVSTSNSGVVSKTVLTDANLAIGSSYLSGPAGAGWLQADLGSVRFIDSSFAYWYAGDGRRYNYAVAISEDGTTWKWIVGNGSAAGVISTYVPSRAKINSYGPSGVRFPTIDKINDFARYVRIYVNGSTSNSSAHWYQWQLWCGGAPADPYLEDYNANLTPGATKNVVTYASTQPSGADGDIWVDTSVNPNVTKVYDGGWKNASNYVTNTNQVTDGAGLGNTAQWGSVSGIPFDAIYANDDSVALGYNPTFSAWSGSVPDGWAQWSTVVGVKETTIKRVGEYAIKYTFGASQQGGMSRRVMWDTAPMAADTFVAGTVDAYLSAYTGPGKPGLLVDLYYSATASRRTYVPLASTATGVWQRIPFTARLNPGEKLYGIQIYVMGSYNTSGLGGYFQGTVIFDNLRFAFFDASVDNRSVKVSANGTLSGGGGGQVTITGLGYSGALNATKNTIYRQATAPTSGVADGDIWVDTSLTPNVQKVRVSGGWVIAATVGAKWGDNITNQPTSIGGINAAEGDQLYNLANAQINLVPNSGFLRSYSAGTNQTLPVGWAIYNNGGVPYEAHNFVTSGVFNTNIQRVIAKGATSQQFGIYTRNSIDSAAGIKGGWISGWGYHISFYARSLSGNPGLAGKKMTAFYSNMGFTNQEERLNPPLINDTWQRYEFYGVASATYGANHPSGELYISWLLNGTIPANAGLDISCVQVEPAFTTRATQWQISPHDKIGFDNPITPGNASTYIADAWIGQAIVAGALQSSDYASGGGWAINKNGNADFRNITARGNIEATSIKANTANIIDTLMIQGEAINVPRSVHTGAFVAIGGWTTVQSLYIDAGGGSVTAIGKLAIRANYTQGEASSSIVALQIVDPTGTVIDYIELYADSGIAMVPAILVGRSTASGTYLLQAAVAQSGVMLSSIGVERRVLTLLGSKR